MRAPAKKTGAKKKARRIKPPAISVRLIGHITLEAQTDGNIAAYFDGYAVGLGKFSAEAAARAQALSKGLPLGSFPSDGNSVDKEIHLLVQRLARRGLLEYRLGNADDDEDQRRHRTAGLRLLAANASEFADTDVIVLSRFAYSTAARQ